MTDQRSDFGSGTGRERGHTAPATPHPLPLGTTPPGAGAQGAATEADAASAAAATGMGAQTRGEAHRNTSPGAASPDEGGLGAMARSQAQRLAEPLRHDARLIAERQKERGAERLGGFAAAMHRAADELQAQLPETAACIHDFAGGMERMSSRLRTQSVEDVSRTFTNVARNQPAAVFGGAVLAGLALSRFLKSSSSGMGR